MKLKRSLLGLFVVCQFSAVSSEAATLTWDANGTGAGVVDGAGTWTTANDWYNGTANVTWVDANKDIAAFGNTASVPVGVAGAVTATATVGGLVFNPYYAINAKYNLTGGTLTFSTATGVPTVVMNTHPSRPFAAVNSIIAGTQGFDLSNSSGGIFEIGTQANTITGGIRLRNGSSLAIGSDSGLGGAGSGLTFSDASATLITRTTSTLAAARPITISAGNTGRFDTLNGVVLTLAPTGGVTGGSLVKEGLGGLLLNTGNAYTGQTGVRQGVLTLNFVNATAPVAPATNIVNPASTLRLFGGSLSVAGKASVNNAQTFAGTILDPGASGMVSTIGAAGTVVTNLGTITRNAGSTLDISNIVAGSSYTAANSNTNGILGGYATVAGPIVTPAVAPTTWDWATVSAGNLVAYTGYQTGTDATAWAAADNVTAAATPTVPLAADSSINSLRLTDATTIAIPGSNALTLGSGGLLSTGPGAGVISGGTLKGESGKGLNVIQNSTADLAISSVIANNGTASALTKSGSGSLTLTGANTFSGNVFLNAGTLSANSDSALGAGSTVTSRTGTTLILAGTSAITSAKNFVFDTGSDSYGATVLGGGATDVGNANIKVSNPAGATLSGAFNVTAGTLVKSGPGVLTMTNAGSNQLGRLNGSGIGAEVQEGGFVFNGGAASEWNVGQAEFHIGVGTEGTKASAKGGSVVVNSGKISVGSWTGVSRGSGTTNQTSSIAMTSGSWNTGYLSLGYANGVTGYSATSILDLSGDSKFAVMDVGNLSESTGSTAIVNVAGTAQFTTRNTMKLGMANGATATLNLSGTSVTSTAANLALGSAAGATGTVNLSGSASLSSGTYAGIGAPGIGVLNMQDSATYTVGTDFNIADNDSSRGTLNMSGGTVNAVNFYVGKGSNQTTVLNTNGVLNQSGGTVNISGTVDARVGGTAVNDSEVYGAVNLSGGAFNAGARNFQVGLYGKGVLDISGTASFSCTNGYPSIARQTGSVGLFNMSGGTFTHTTSVAGFTTLGEIGSGVLNVSGGTMSFGGVDGATAGLRIALNSAATGVANFNGGTVNARAITGGPGNSSAYFNGAQLKPLASRADFIQTLTSAIVGPGGLKIDTSGFDVTAAQTFGTATGSGVTGIAVSSGGAGYMAQPIVQISGGGGTGATAIATVSGGVVTGFTITNPGKDYTGTPTVTLLNGGSTTAATVGAVTTGANAVDGGLAKTGTGTLTLSGFSTYNGPTNVTGGTLALGSSSSIPSTSALTLTGADLNTGTSATQSGPVVVNGGNILGTGQLQGASYAISTATGTTTISAQLAGADVNLTKTGAGTLALTGSNTYSGLTTLSGGITTLGAAGSLDSTSSLAVNGATLDIRNGTASRSLYLNNLTLSNATILAGMIGASNDAISANGIASISGTNIIKISGSASSGPHTIISAGSPLTGTYTLDTTGMVSGFTTYTGAVSGSNYIVTASGAATPGNAWWKGGVGADWTQAGAAAASNWATTQAGTTNTKQVPGATTDVHFSANTPANTATTLSANLSIKSLSFQTGSASVTSPTSTLSILGFNSSIGADGNGYPLEVFAGATAGMNVNTVYTGTTAIQSGGTLTVSGGSLGNASEPLLLEGTLNVNADVTKGQFSGSGTIDKTLAGTSTFTIGDFNDVTISGPIKNTTGTLNFTKGGTGKMTLTGTNNTFSGTLKIASGILERASAGAIPNISGIIQQPSSTFLNSVAGSMSIAYPYSFDLNGGVSDGVNETIGSGEANYTIDLPSDTTISGLLSNNGGSVAKRGTGTLRITNPGANVIGNVTAGAHGLIGLAVQNGSVILDGGAAATYAVGNEVAVGDVVANSANLTLNSGTLNVPTYLSASRGGVTNGITSTIDLKGGTLNAQFLYCGYSNGLAGYNANSVINLDGTTANLTAVRIGESGGSTGTLNLKTGALTATGAFQIGYNGLGVADVKMPISVGNVQIAGAANGSGAIYNNNVMTVTAAASTTNFAIGNGANSYGYYRSNAGAALAVAELGVGGATGGATGGGVLDLTAGTVSASAWITPNRGTAGQTSLLNITGGTLTTPNVAGQFRVNMDVANQYALINVGGTGSIIGGGVNSNLNLNNASQVDTQGILTIGTGGTVQLTGIFASGTAGNAIVNFNGGTLKAGGAAPALLGTGLTGVYLNGGGAIIDTNTFDAGITPPLLAPASVGVATIPLKTQGAGYIGRPLVRIIGDGVGATAVADFNPTTGAVTGITITNPGSGYNTAPTVTLIGGGNPTVAAVVDTITMGNVSSTGGLVKNGTGTLTLNGLNTYTGNTVINAGGLTLADNAQLKFVIGANGVTNSVSGIGSATFSGDFEIDTTGAALANGNSWTLVNTGTPNKTFSATFSVNGFTESADVWTKTVGSNVWTFSEATGVLSLSIASAGGYGSWQTTYGLGANSEQGDPDGDGIKNLMEYVLGGIPTGAGAANTSILPTQSLNATNLVLTFRRSDISEADTTVKVQWSSDMVNWNDFATVGATSALPAVQVTEDSPDPTLDTIVVTIPRAGKEANGKLFGRVKAVK